MIEAKIARSGKTAPKAPSGKRATNVIDLVAVLQQSLGSGKKIICPGSQTLEENSPCQKSGLTPRLSETQCYVREGLPPETRLQPEFRAGRKRHGEDRPLLQQITGGLRFLTKDLIKRVAESGDIFAETPTLKQALRKVEFSQADE